MNLKPIFSYLQTSESSLELNKFPLIVCDDNFHIRPIGGGANFKGFLTITIAFGTLSQVNSIILWILLKNSLDFQI